MVAKKRKTFLPRIYINPADPIPSPSYDGKIEESVRQITKSFVKSSGIAVELARNICSKNWKSAWLMLIPDDKRNHASLL